jgi:hypothetical protein
MANCPKCGSPGAYVGFNSVECRNPKCIHFVIEEEAICPCCGKRGHVPGQKAGAKKSDASDPQDVDAPQPGEAEGEEAPF